MSQSKEPGQEASGSALLYARYAPQNGCVPWWLNKPFREEEELLRIGSPGIPPILEAIQNPAVHWHLRTGLIILLGQIGEDRAVPALLSIIGQETNEITRQYCFDAIGLIRSKKYLAQIRSYLDKRVVGSKIILWAMGMCGDADASDKYLDTVRRLIASEELVDVAGEFGIPALSLGEGAIHLRLAAKVTPINQDLADDIWRLGHLRDPRVVKIFIAALGYHNGFVQHMALANLENQLDVGRGMRDRQHEDIHTLRVYEKWNQWCAEHGSALRWDDSAKKYHER